MSDKLTFTVEVREASRAGYEPTLHGIMLVEGRAASGGRRELFAPGSVTWPHDGVGITVGHHAEDVEARAHPTRQRDGRITLAARATAAIQKAVEDGAKFMSVEFLSLRERRTAGGVREILAALVPRAALVRNPEYDTTAAEVRSRGRRRRIWL